MGNLQIFLKNSKKLESFIGAGVNFIEEFIMKGTLRNDGLTQGWGNADWVCQIGYSNLIFSYLLPKRLFEAK